MTSMVWTVVGRMLARKSASVRPAPSLRGRMLRVLALLLVGLCVYAVYQAPRTELLQIRKLEVQGVRHMTAGEIREVSGLIGTPIWRVDTAKAEERLERLPYVARATVDAGWSSEVGIRIEERSPHVVWRNATGSYLVDAEGIVLEKAAEKPQLPLLEVEEDRVLVPGQKLDARQLLFVLTLYSELPNSLRPNVAKLTYSEGNGYQLVSTSGWTAVLGDASRIGVKAEVLRQVLKRGKVKFMDVSSPTTPYYRADKR